MHPNGRNAMTGSLTAAEAASYRERGYLFPVPALGAAELDEARANLAATEAGSRGGTTRSPTCSFPGSTV
jgi:hypothetical protein